MLEPITPWADIPAKGPLLRVPEAAAYLGYKSPSRYYTLAREGALPAPIKIGSGFSGVSGVPKDWLDAIIAKAAAA